MYIHKVQQDTFYKQDSNNEKENCISNPNSW